MLARIGTSPRERARFDWTEEAIAEMTRLWQAGHPASIIAEKLGWPATRFSVLGKIHRLKIQGRRNRRVSRRVLIVKSSKEPKLPVPKPRTIRRDEWTAQQLSDLKRLAPYAELADIANAIGRSIKAVRSKARNLQIRLGVTRPYKAPHILARMYDAPKSAKKPKGAIFSTVTGLPKTRAEVAVKPKPKHCEPAFAPIQGGVSIADLGPGHCKWPHDCEDGTRYCGEARADMVEGRPPYCQTHRGLSLSVKRAA